MGQVMRSFAHRFTAIILIALYALKPCFGSKQDRPAIGIHLGSNTISAAILDDRSRARPFALLNGDDFYQAYMRQGLWSGKPGKARKAQPERMHERAQQLLQPLSPPGPIKLKSVLQQLKSHIVKEIGHDPFNVVLGVPSSFQPKHRREIRKFLTQHLGLDLTILTTARQPALATAAFDLHSYSRETTVLVLDYNHASLDITLAVTVDFMTDIFAHISLPSLGEDFLLLKLASLAFRDSLVSDEALRSHAREITMHSVMAVDSNISSDNYTSEMHAVESAHFDTAIKSMLDLVHQQTHTTEITGPNWKPVLSDLSHILISGDASSRGFKKLREAIAAEESILAGLLDPGLEMDAPLPIWVTAHGAAKNVAQRRYESDGQWDWHAHGEL
ncbi:MAG: hypothetical protein L6R36_008197 [Xanthoria steineri]|nr:MAG: hypothetical protein L6R36_008197 [Xanthoria steineri]